MLALSPCFAQEQTVMVHNDIHCLGTRGCAPQTSVRIDLPPGTIRWFYTVNTTRKLKKARKIKKNPALRSLFSKESGSMPVEFEPVFGGDGHCSVYLLKHPSDAEGFVTAGGVYFFYPEYSKKNVPTLGMVIDEPLLCYGTRYIGLEKLKGQIDPLNSYAVLTVVAIIQKAETPAGR